MSSLSKETLETIQSIGKKIVPDSSEKFPEKGEYAKQSQDIKNIITRGVNEDLKNLSFNDRAKALETTANNLAAYKPADPKMASYFESLAAEAKKSSDFAKNNPQEFKENVVNSLREQNLEAGRLQNLQTQQQQQQTKKGPEPDSPRR